MRNFINEAYEPLVSDLINDAFYLEDRSRRGTISTIRQYAEVIVRKILNLPENRRATLGDLKIVEKLKDISSENELLMESVDHIRKIGNKCTHTQSLDEITKNDVKIAIDKLFNLYAYLFIAHFEKYTFGTNHEIMSAFSILPPIIRFITLNNLYENDKNNLFLIDKLSLVILKVYDKKTAIDWVEERKVKLSQTLTYTTEDIEQTRERYGDLVAQSIKDNAPDNMYVLCIERIDDVSSIIEHRGRLYENFEQAMPLFLEKGKVEEESEEAKNFNSIMEFIYLGRKPSENEKLKQRHLYTIVK